MSQNYAYHVQQAQDFYDEGNYEAARAACLQALADVEANQSDLEARILQALSLRKLEFEDEAFEALCALQNESPDPRVAAELALIYAERGKADERCQELAEWAISEDSDSAAAYLALYWVHVKLENELEALRYLKRALRRGAEFPEQQAFTVVHSWCQHHCNEDDYAGAYAISQEIVDFYASFDFLILHARLAEFAGQEREAVSYYKKILLQLRPGQLRTDVLEAIAKIAI